MIFYKKDLSRILSPTNPKRSLFTQPNCLHFSITVSSANKNPSFLLSQTVHVCIIFFMKHKQWGITLITFLRIITDRKYSLDQTVNKTVVLYEIKKIYCNFQTKTCF